MRSSCTCTRGGLGTYDPLTLSAQRRERVDATFKLERTAPGGRCRALLSETRGGPRRRVPGPPGSWFGEGLPTMNPSLAVNATCQFSCATLDPSGQQLVPWIAQYFGQCSLPIRALTQHARRREFPVTHGAAASRPVPTNQHHAYPHHSTIKSPPQVRACTVRVSLWRSGSG